MIKLDSRPMPVEHAAPLHVEVVSTHRLIVLIPSEADSTIATHRIWELATAANMPVQLLALCENAIEEPGLRRKLVTMGSLLQDGKVAAEVLVVTGTNWVAAVKNHYEVGDIIVCSAEQRTGLLQRPLSQMLESNLKATIYILSGFAPSKSRSNVISLIAFWLGFISIILGFGLLQTKIVLIPGTSVQNILLILSILPEFWLIWTWNSLFG